jgi:cell division protein FtsI/penicillin-binding protein 2
MHIQDNPSFSFLNTINLISVVTVWSFVVVAAELIYLQTARGSFYAKAIPFLPLFYF